MPFSILFVAFVGPILRLFFKRRKAQYMKTSLEFSTFYTEDWILEQKLTKITDADEIELERQLLAESSKIPNDSILDYLVNRRGNVQRQNETKKEFVVRLMKIDFEKNHGLQLDEFISLCKEIREENPEMLI